jgi:hypothetical protein
MHRSASSLTPQNKAQNKVVSLQSSKKKGKNKGRNKQRPRKQKSHRQAKALAQQEIKLSASSLSILELSVEHTSRSSSSAK